MLQTLLSATIPAFLFVLILLVSRPAAALAQADLRIPAATGDGITNLAERWNGTDSFNPADRQAGQTPVRGSLPLFLPRVSHD